MIFSGIKKNSPTKTKMYLKAKRLLNSGVLFIFLTIFKQKELILSLHVIHDGSPGLSERILATFNNTRFLAAGLGT